MIIGCLGDIVFQTSEDVVRTLDSMVWSGSARYAVHNRHGANALTEFTGLDPDKITFNITLCADLGVDPMAEMAKLWDLERSGRAVPLTVGTKCYGKYRWTIVSSKMKPAAHFVNGDVHTATVSVSLQEYLRE